MERGNEWHDNDSNRPVPQRTRIFVVRIWFEPSGSETGPMRGTLKRLGGPSIGAFRSMAGLQALLEQALADCDVADATHPDGTQK